LCATGKGAALHRHATEEVFIPAKGRIGERRITAGDDPSEADPSLAHVEHKIETRCEAGRGFGYSHRQIAAE
jgi:hypothetical protein